MSRTLIVTLAIVIALVITVGVYVCNRYRARKEQRNVPHDLERRGPASNIASLTKKKITPKELGTMLSASLQKLQIRSKRSVHARSASRKAMIRVLPNLTDGTSALDNEAYLVTDPVADIHIVPECTKASTKHVTTYPRDGALPLLNVDLIRPGSLLNHYENDLDVYASTDRGGNRDSGSVYSFAMLPKVQASSKLAEQASSESSAVDDETHATQRRPNKIARSRHRSLIDLLTRRRHAAINSDDVLGKSTASVDDQARQNVHKDVQEASLTRDVEQRYRSSNSVADHAYSESVSATGFTNTEPFGSAIGDLVYMEDEGENQDYQTKRLTTITEEMTARGSNKSHISKEAISRGTLCSGASSQVVTDQDSGLVILNDGLRPQASEEQSKACQASQLNSALYGYL